MGTVHAQSGRSTRLLVVACALSLVVGACSGDDDGGASGGERDGDSATQVGDTADVPELKLAYMGPMTGDFAAIGAGGRDAIQLAIDAANAAGDLPVRLKLKVFDTQLDSTQAQLLTADVIADSSIVGSIGPLSSGEVKAAAPTLNDAGVPFVTVASNPDLARQGWAAFHRLMANDEVQAREAARYMTTVLTPDAVSVIHDNTEYGKALAVLTKKALEERDVDVQVDAIEPREVDFSAAVNIVKARQPAVVFYAGYYPEAGRLIKQLRDAGVTAKFFSGDAARDPGIAEGAGKVAEGVQVTCACADPAHQPDPAAQAFSRSYQKRFGRAPGLYAAEFHDGALVLIDAIRRGGRTRATVLKNLKTGRVEGVTKRFTFQPDGEVGEGSVYVYEFRDGAFTSLGTTDELGP